MPYWREPDSAVEKYECLKLYPAAGRLWRELRFNDSMSIGMVKAVIAGSSNVKRVYVDAFWNEEEAKMVLDAIEGLNRVDDITFGDEGLRRWRRSEIETFMKRMSLRIRLFEALDVENSSAQSNLSESAGLQLAPCLRFLTLDKYPPLTSLSLRATCGTYIYSIWATSPSPSQIPLCHRIWNGLQFNSAPSLPEQRLPS
ncbi:hypothetical protein BT69DRAFT_1334774 [Atractiella rhizophila]|nr:hypothetical protein BT69DRAFT_1334774 [Atractiella rhizophila]